MNIEKAADALFENIIIGFIVIGAVLTFPLWLSIGAVGWAAKRATAFVTAKWTANRDQLGVLAFLALFVFIIPALFGGL